MWIALTLSALGALLCLVLAIRRPWALLAVLAVVAAVRPVGRISSGTSGMALIGVLGDTGRLQLLFGALLAFGLALSG